MKPEHPEPPEFSDGAESLKPHVLAFGPTQTGKRRPSVLERMSGQSPGEAGDEADDHHTSR